MAVRSAVSGTALSGIDAKRLSQLARTNDLTGLHNHRYLMQRLQEEVSRNVRYNSGLALLFVDIDRFKRVNDACGHAAGDEALRRFTQLLRATVEGGSIVAYIRRYDIVDRYGGEEFALLLPMTDIHAAKIVAERIRTEVEPAPISYRPGQHVGITVSLGIATLPNHATDVKGLTAAADEALYRAKNKARNRIEHA